MDTIEVNPRKLGFEFDTFIGIDVRPERYINVLEKLKSLKEVISLYSSSGDHMALIRCWFRSSGELVNFVRKLRKVEGITRVCPAIVLERIK
ncbi:MAG: hypothetical protein B6U69_03385 [Thermofilum sp. ex4484_15]|nr:MAG: hypothetical protein B6U69_03385 [Thermofilum sp. ex4484_15]